MRNLLFSMLTAIFLIASCQWADAQTSLLNENFNSTTSGVPTGWDDTDYNCSASYRWKSDASGYNSTRCVRFNTYSASSGSYSALKTPVLNLNQPFTLRFKYKNYNAGTLSVYISTDGGATYLNTALGTNLTTPDASTWQEAEYSLGAYTGQSNVRIVFYGVSNYGSQRQYIDDVVVESAPTCKAPSGIYVTNMTTTTADLNWGLTQDGDNPGSFQLTVTDEGGNTVLTDNSVGGTLISYALTGLSANTTYTATMRGDCSGTLGGYSKYASVTFTTACVYSNLPYYEDFDALTGIPDCTQSLNASIQTSTKYGTSGKSLKITATSADNAYIVFPAQNHAANDVQMTFYAKSSITAANIYQVGIVTDPADIEGTFEPLRVDSFTENSTWHEIRLNTADASVSTAPARMCIFLGSGKSASIYIDNVSIIQTPNCVRPEQLRAFNPTATSIDLDWTTSTSGTHIIDVTDADGITVPVTANSNPYTVTGLQPNSQYTFRLRAYCGVGDTSEYAPGSVTAKTLCLPLTTTIWSESAEGTTGTNLPDCWISGWTTRPTSGTTYDNPFVTQTTNVHSGLRAFKLQDMASGSFSYLTSPGFPIANANEHQVSIWVYRASGSSNVGEGLRLFASNNPDNTVGAQELGFINRMAGNAPVEAEGAGWYNYTFPISITGTVYLIIQGESKYGSATNFDDISIELAPTCMAPGDATLGTLTPNNDIDLTWSAGVSGETSWTLAYELMIGNSVVTSDSIEVTNPSYTFTNLSAATTYNVKARIYAMCTPTDISAAKKFNGSFSTPCGTVTSFPYVQDFEGGAVPPICWSQMVVSGSTSGSYTNSWNITTTQKHAGTYGAAIPDKQAGCKTALTTGALDLSDPAGYQVSYWQYRPSNSYQSKVDEAMHIFVHPTDSLDETTAVEIGVVNNHYLNAPAEASSGWYQYTFDIPTTVTGLQHVSFCYHNQYGSGSYIDDVMIRVAPTCRDLAAPTISDIQPNSARVSIADTSATAWDISYGPMGTAAGAGTVVTVTGAQDYVLTGLTANTNYDVYVRRNCGTEFGMWTLAPVQFTAICTDATATTTNADAYSFDVKANTTSWEISYGPTGTTAAAGTIVPVSGTDEYTVTGLTPATQYVYYVRHDCGGGDYSAWSSAYSVKTTIVPDSIPVSTGFEDDTDNNLWTIVNGTNTVNTFTFGTDANAVASGSKALYIQTSNAYGYYTSSATKTYAYRTIYFGSGVHNFSFKWKCTGGESTWDFARIMLVPASEALVGGTGTSYSGTTFPAYIEAFDPIEGKAYINLAAGDANGWNTYAADVDMTGREGTYNFVVMWSNDGSAGTSQYPISIDNLVISQVTCNKPTVQVSDISSTGLTVTAVSQETQQYEIAISDTVIDIFGAVTGNIYQGVTSAPVVLTGLNVNTPYYYTARAICGVGDTSAWADVQIGRTACDNYNTPYTEGFEDMGALNCWPSFSTGTALPTRNTAYKYAGQASVKVNDAVAVSPTLNVTTLATYMLNGWAYSTSDSVQFAVGVMVDPSDQTTYEPLGTVMIPAKNTWTEFTTYFSLLTDPDYADWYNAQHFAIAAAADATIYLDNLYLGDIPTCPKPTETAISNVLANSFTMGWTENGTATSWRIKAVPDVTGQATVDTVVTTNPANIIGLEPASGYTIEIQAICSATDTSLVTMCGHIRTTCSIVNTPYEETFEFMTANATPDCWDISASSTSSKTSNPQYVWGVYETGGNKMLRMYNYLVSSGSAIINTPVIALGNTNASSLTFDYCHQSSSPDLYVLISNNGGTTWDTIGTYSGASGSSTAPSSWNTVTVPLNSYIGQNVIIRFFNMANYGNGALFIDNVKVLEGRNCATPSDVTTVTPATTNSVQIDWTPGGTETEWIIRVQNASSTSYVNTTTHPYTITGLNAASNYLISVAALCGVGDTSYFAAPITVATLCDVIAAPMTEDFEAFTVGTIPNCWDNSASTATGSSPDYVWGVHANGGNKMIRMYDYWVQSGDAIIETPSYALLGSVNGYTFKFDHSHLAPYCDPVTVEISNNNGTSWTTLTTFGPTGGSNESDPGTFTTSTHNLAAYNGDTVKFRFSVEAQYYSGAIFVDNLRLIQNRSCADLVGINVNYSDTIAAVNINDTVSTHTQWQYMFGTAGFDTTGVTPVLIDTPYFALTSLAAVTSYDVYVRAYCDAAEQSNWVFKSFKTTSAPAPLPYICHFTDATENAAWSLVTSATGTGTNTFTIGSEAAALSTGETAALYVTNGSGYTYTTSGGASSSGAYRLFHFDASQYHLSFKWKCTGGESSYDYARFYLAPAVEPIYLPAPGSYQSTGWPSPMLALDGGNKVNLTTSPEWNEVDVTIDMSNAPGSYHLVFIWSNDGSAGTAQYPLAINDIEIEELSCFAPSTLSIPDSTITENSAVVHYQQLGAAGTPVRYWINTTGVRTDTLATGVVTASPITLTGLSASSSYYIFMQSECSATDVSPVNGAQFNTSCGIITAFPFTEGFEGTQFAPNCWTKTGTSAYWNRYTASYTPSNYVHSGTHSAYVSGSYYNSALLSTPQIHFDSLREYNVSFWLYQSTSTYYSDYVKVYLSDNAGTVANATLLGTVMIGSAATTGMPQFSFDIPMFTSGDKYIVFEGFYDYAVYIDDITVDMYPTCRDLASGVTVESSTATTLTVSASKGPNHQGVIFAYAPATATSIADTIGSVYSTTGTAVITGLANSTAYKVYARGVCSATDSTAWTDATVGSTMANNCFEPQNLRVVGLVGATSGTFTWGGAPDAIAYEWMLTGTTIKDTVTTDTIVISNLTPQTSYTLQVRTFCLTDTSAWQTLQFTTSKVSAELPYSCDFEDAVEAGQWELLGNGQTNEFIVGSATSSSSSNSLYITNDGSSNTYSNSSASVSYAIRYFQLPAGQYAYSYNWKAYGESSFDYGRAFLAPENITFTPGSLPSGVSTTGIPAGGYAMDNGKFNLDSTWQNQTGVITINNGGNFNMVFMWRNDGSVGVNPPVAIDDIEFRMLTCPQPALTVVQSSITENSAAIYVANPNVSDVLVYTVSLGTMEDAFLTDTITGQDTIYLNGLPGSSSFNVWVKVLCSATDESFWTQTSFRTLCGQATLPYTESFEELPTSYTGAGMIEVICWNDLNASASSGSYPYYRGDTYYKSEGNRSLEAYSSNTTNLFLILPSFGDIGNCRVTFDAQYESTSYSGTWYLGYMTDPTSAASFTSLYTAAGTTTYQFESHTADLANIPAGARLAFKYGDAASSSYYGWIDNIRVSQLVQGPTYADTVCFGSPYTNYGFNVDEVDVHVGDNTFTRLKAGVSGTPDTLITANVYKYAKVESIVYDTLCQGQPLVWGGVVIQNPTPRAYNQNFPGAAVTGCDSTATLILAIVPTHFDIEDTICRGDAYQFRDSTYTEPGVYTYIGQSQYGCSDTTVITLTVIETQDTIVDSTCKGTTYTWHGTNYTTSGVYYWTGAGSHGCQRYEVLYLTVIDGDSTIYASICQGGTYQFGDTTLTTAGTHIVSRWDPIIECQITYTIHLTISSVVPVEIYDDACEGKPYYGHGIPGYIITQDTVITTKKKTLAGCDSVSNVHLTYNPTVYSYTRDSIAQGEVYYWNGFSYSTDTIDSIVFASVLTGCDSIDYLILTIKTGTGVDYVADVHMSIVPNPVNAGATAFVYGEFGEIEKVEILDNFGQRVDQFTPDTYPIEVSGISTSGLYYVRVTTKSGNVHLQKLIVK